MKLPKWWRPISAPSSSKSVATAGTSDVRQIAARWHDVGTGTYLGPISDSWQGCWLGATCVNLSDQGIKGHARRWGSTWDELDTGLRTIMDCALLASDAAGRSCLSKRSATKPMQLYKAQRSTVHVRASARATTENRFLEG